ncbi:hypothetical protein [Clostridium neonatale]|uniref:Uncharacterized protein n=1 Tax=Clostridium neonatale TaxID=137838 RepID=A0AA86JCS1_9CLOT|nr:hypothetical protein [Clostridium neonatale]CAG9703665.1 conserved hypothetical protein [Clostridium neonatale]CAI3539142.1 conserved hypothetical protein [Clostridium neonatale]CAI3540040.1 conserved hypothetical protein [Clostridium neonatale]CAI3545616.1 conserved hypothetical protein [Clostridium neonatale]CAI3552142.1 conserved hypothetical protein [Clostridium neonatale]
MEKNNNDLFELMTKMYSEMQEMKGEFNNKFDKLEKEVTKTNATIENEIKPSISALLDGYKQNTESINQVSDKVDEIQRDINSLTIKTLRNENNIIDITKIIKNK